MTNSNSLKTVMTLVGAAALTSLMSFPALAQVNPQSDPVNEQTEMSQQQVSDALVALDREFIIMAAQGNNAEIQTSQLALQRAENEAVREYAQQMIEEHTLANERLSAIASEYGMELPTDPGPLNAAIAEQLAQLSDEAFDRAYMGAQENAHLKAIALYRTELQQGQVPEVQSYASELLPRIAEHYEMASRMAPEARAEDTQRPLQ